MDGLIGKLPKVSSMHSSSQPGKGLCTADFDIMQSLQGPERAVASHGGPVESGIPCL